MNKTRRRKLKRAIPILERAAEIIGEVRDQEQAAFENFPETLHSAERYASLEECADTLNEFADSLGEMIGSIEDIVGNA